MKTYLHSLFKFYNLFVNYFVIFVPFYTLFKAKYTAMSFYTTQF